MATQVKIPTPDQTTEEVRIVKWCKALGDAVNKGDILLEIETDKAILEVEAGTSGILLKQLFAEEEIVAVGTVVGYIGEKGEQLDVTTKVVPSSAVTQAAAILPSSVTGDTSVKASPLARKVADKLGIDISCVSGTGHDGKIMRRDVEEFGTLAQAKEVSPGRTLASPNARRLARNLAVDLAGIAGTGPGGRIIGRDVKTFAEGIKATAPEQVQAGKIVPLTKMRRAIALNLQTSFREKPHFNVTMSADMTGALEMRSKFNQSCPEDKRLSVNHLVIMACAKTLRQYPAVNSRFEDDGIRYLDDINVGIATALEFGLVVPVLVNADKLGWQQLVAQTRNMVDQARSGKIIDAGKGTFTVTNLGMFGVEEFTAIINPPESAILAVGTVMDTAVDVGGSVGIRPMMKLTLCSDHRVIDGVLAAQFLCSMVQWLEAGATDTA